MKLSEAGLLGSSLMEEGCEYSNCFIGAAVAAIGKHRRFNPVFTYAAIDEIALREWPWLNELRADPTTGQPRSILGIIGGLNGHHTRTGMWTRPAIAAWVATIEPREMPAGEVLDAAPSIQMTDYAVMESI